MSDMIVKHIPHTCDLDAPIKKTFIDTLLATEDNLAHCFDIAICHGAQEAQLPSGTAVTAYFIRYSDGVTVPIKNGTISGNVASVTLTKACYNKAGQFAIIIKVAADGVTNTVFYGEGTIFTSSTDTIVDEENVIPSLADLLAQIAVMEAATANANTATTNATNAANLANTAAAAAEPWGNVTVSAQSVDPNEEADVDVTTNTSGGKHMGFSIPRGQPGVQVSDTEPTDPNVNVWIQPDGVTDDNGYTVDTSRFAYAIMDESARAASHELHAQRGPLAVTLYGQTTETGTGDKSPDNPYTISGVDAANIYTSGMNMFDADAATDGYVLSGSGAPSENAGYFVSDYIAIGGDFTVQFSTITDSIRIAFYDANKVFIDRPYYLTSPVTLNRPDARYVRLSSKIEDKPYVQIEPGNKATEYKPYAPINLPLLPDGAPLMGNGTVDDTVENDVLVDGERRCRVTRRWKTVALTGSEPDSMGSAAYGGYRIRVELPNDMVVLAAGALPEISCSHYPESTRDGTYMEKLGISSVVPTVPSCVYIYDDRYNESDSLAAFKEWVAAQHAAGTPVTITFQLATPEVYLTDPHTLRKPDTLTTDTVTVTGSGETAVEYPHDTKHYIDQKFEALAAALLS